MPFMFLKKKIVDKLKRKNFYNKDSSRRKWNIAKPRIFCRLYSNLSYIRDPRTANHGKRMLFCKVCFHCEGRNFYPIPMPFKRTIGIDV